MEKACSPIRDERGSLLLEALLAGAVFSILVMGIVGAVIYGVQSAELATRRAQASGLAKEGLEASRNIRDAAFTNLVDGTYGLSAGTQWAFSGSSDVTDIFTRTVTVSTIDSTTKQVVSNVTWSQTPQRTGNVAFTTYFTNWRIAKPNRWSLGTQESTLNLSGAQDGIKVQVAGNYAYVIRNDGTPDFAIIDISTPTAPTLVASLSLTGAPVNIAVSGNYAYISTTADAAELQIVNIATPTAPTLAGTYNAAGTTDGAGIYAVGTTVYLGRASGAVQDLLIINAATPALPILSGGIALTNDVLEIYVSGNYAYVVSSGDSAEVMVVNVSVPLLPVLAATLNLVGTSNALTVTGTGTTLYVGRSGGEIGLISIATPTSPALISSVNIGNDVNDLALGKSNTLLFAATSSSAADFAIYDVTSSTAPTLINSLNLSSVLYGIAYDATRDRAVGVGADDTFEVRIFRPN